MLIAGEWGSHVVNAATYVLPYDVVMDFEPVALLASNPSMIVAKKSIPANDLKEFIAWLKGNPDKATFGTNGVGGAPHIFGLLFKLSQVRVFNSYRIGGLVPQCRIWLPDKSMRSSAA